ncbi:glycosyltransferase family 2 protein [Marinomonas gallaica]|uniref:glycosyltransferase family 2 protein n=1 Tax=Marinomonas gallaica TaxID=1806667 RepID=UPI003CE4A283
MSLSSTPVSVIIRTKDRSDYLALAVQSVLQQTYRPLELVVINDGGCDVHPVLHDLLDTEQHIELRYVHHNSSVGRANAANSGLQHATSPWSMFLDDDDYLDPQHIELLVTRRSELNLAVDDLAVTHSQARAVHIEGVNGAEQCLSIHGAQLEQHQLFYQNQLPILTVLLPTRVREMGIAFDADFDLFEDWDFWLQVYTVCHFEFIEQVTCAYRIHQQGSGVRDRSQQQCAFRQVYEKWLPKLSLPALYSLLAKSHEWQDNAIGALQQQNQASLNHIGALHSHALQVIDSKDKDIAHLTTIYQKMEQDLQAVQAQKLALEHTLNDYQKDHRIVLRTSLFYLLKSAYKYSKAILRKLVAR